jgi:hypothetical protein
MEEKDMANQKLPGMIFTYRDGGLTPAVLLPTTEQLFILGNALDGPVNTPISIQNISDAQNIFGPLTYTGDYINPQTGIADNAYADNNLLKAVTEALLGGAGNVACVRVGGQTASITGAWNSVININAINPGRIYNSVTVVSTSGSTGYTITLNQTPSKGGSIFWTFTGIQTLGNLVSTINNDTRNRSIIMNIPATSATTPISGLGIGTAALSGTTSGTNGTGAPMEDYAGNKSGYYTALTQQYGTFDSLGGIPFDVAVLVGIYMDDQVVSAPNDTTTSVAQAFANFLYTASRETQPCHGVIGVRPSGLKSPAELSIYATNALLNPNPGYYNVAARWINAGYFMQQGFFATNPDDGSTVDIGGYLSVVAAPDIIYSQKNIGYYLENAAAAYAGMITSLPAQSATTNKALGTIKLINGTLSKSTQELLNQGLGYNPAVAGSVAHAAYVTIKYNSVLNAPVIVSDNTCALRTSDYHTLQILRVANLASFMAKAVLYPFIGEADSIEARTAMKTQLTTALQKMVDAGALLGGDGNGFKFTITSDPVDLLLGQITVTMFLRPAMQIKYIQVVVNISQ